VRVRRISKPYMARWVSRFQSKNRLLYAMYLDLQFLVSNTMSRKVQIREGERPDTWVTVCISNNVGSVKPFLRALPISDSEMAIQGTTMRSSTTENPAESAAKAKRLSPQTKVLRDGRCSHQTSEAASWRLSAARNEYLSNDCVAKSRTWSPGRTSLQARLSNCKRATAPRFSGSEMCLSRWRRHIAL
jgi:hypothetical protein